MADSSKRLWFKQAIVKAVFLHLYRRHFKKLHWCYLSTKSANVPENIIPQAYCTGPVQCSLFSLRNTWQSGPFLLLLVPCSNVISRLWQPMFKVEKKQHKQTGIVRFTEFFQICLLFGTIHRSNLALFMLTKIISSLFCIEFSLALILLILIELSSVSLF